MSKEGIKELKEEIKKKVAELDNYYVQITIHHERECYREAALVFKSVGVAQRQLEALQNRLAFYQAAEKLASEGILVEVVKRANGSLAMA